MTLPDVQNEVPEIKLAVDDVGINIRYPVRIKMKAGSVIDTISNIVVGVNLSECQRGTHMSRLVDIIHRQSILNLSEDVPEILKEIKKGLNATKASFSLSCPIFVYRQAPKSGKVAKLDFDCFFKARYYDTFNQIVGVGINATSCCPCSKEISKYGAHNQRVYIKALVNCPRYPILWFEDLASICELSASSKIYPILKREDEQWVTEKAYENPKFVEDIVRGVAWNLWGAYRNKISFRVEVRSFESIHNHDAYAKIDAGLVDWN